MNQAGRRRLSILTALAALTLVAAAPEPRLDEAIEAQRELAAERGADAATLNDLGNLLYLAGDLDDARAAYREALAIDPEHGNARLNLALLLQEHGKGRRAHRELKRHLRVHPDDAWGHYYAGMVQQERRQRSSAVRHFAAALRLEPRLAEPSFNPHAVGNELLVRATLRAYSDLPAAAWSSRRYDEAARIAELLVPVRSAAPEGEPDAGAADVTPKPPADAVRPDAPAQPPAEAAVEPPR